MALEHYRAQISFIAAGQYCMCVQHYGIQDPIDPNPFVNARHLARAFEIGGFPNELTLLQNILSPDTYVSSIRTMRSEGGGATFVVAYAATDWAGTFGTHLAAQQVACFIKWMSAEQAGLWNGNFIPGVAEEALNANRFTDAYLSAVDTYATQHIGGLPSPTGLFFPEMVKTKPFPTEFFPITNSQVSMTAGTQRRRLIPV